MSLENGVIEIKKGNLTIAPEDLRREKNPDGINLSINVSSQNEMIKKLSKFGVTKDQLEGAIKAKLAYIEGMLKNNPNFYRVAGEIEKLNQVLRSNNDTELKRLIEGLGLKSIEYGFTFNTPSPITVQKTDSIRPQQPIGKPTDTQRNEPPITSISGAVRAIQDRQKNLGGI